MTYVARHVHVRQEVHLDADQSVALACFAPSALHVEREATRFVAALARDWRRREQLPDRREQAGVGGRIAARRASDRRLVDADQLVEILQPADGAIRRRLAARHLYGASGQPAPYGAIVGLENFDKLVSVDQAPIGRTPRSNPATYTGLFAPIRELFASTPIARERGYEAGRFSFNVKGGRCEACEGDGLIRVEMHFLPDVYVPCDVCHGRRYNRETLEVLYRGLNIAEVLDLTVEQAGQMFSAVPSLQRRLQTLAEVGLGYVRLGQSATTLSGGEAQRIKLALELSKRDTGRTLYVLDEPTTGLHFHDVALLLRVLHRLRDAGNTVIVIEHNLEVIKTADWLVDLGPEGGQDGGRVVACGTPEQVAAAEASYTGRCLRGALAARTGAAKAA